MSPQPPHPPHQRRPGRGVPPRRPDFLVIGAQKCATSWLFRHLAAHPDIWMPPKKELEFFSYQAHLQDPGFDAYLAHFAAAGEARAVGEASPSYFWSPTETQWASTPPGFQPDIAAVVHRLLGPDIRLLLALRDPADRALSAWAHYVAHGELDPDAPFSEAAAYGGVVEMGFYAMHLRRWLDRFPAGRIMVLSVEDDILRRGTETLRRAAAFLDVDPDGMQPAIAEDLVFEGARRVADGRGGIRFEAPDIHPDRAVPKHGLDAGEWAALRAVFRDDVRRLDRMLDRGFYGLWGYAGSG